MPTSADEAAAQHTKRERGARRADHSDGARIVRCDTNAPGGDAPPFSKGDTIEAVLPCPALARAFELFEDDAQGRVDLKSEGLL